MPLKKLSCSFKPQRGKFTRVCLQAQICDEIVSNPNGVNLHFLAHRAQARRKRFKPQRGKFTQ